MNIRLQLIFLLILLKTSESGKNKDRICVFGMWHGLPEMGGPMPVVWGMEHDETNDHSP